MRDGRRDEAYDATATCSTYRQCTSSADRLDASSDRHLLASAAVAPHLQPRGSHKDGAPRGGGSVKLAGNYAPDLKPNTEAKQSGYPIGLYLDAGSRTYVEEFSTSNFVGICGETGKYVTPESDAILPSITISRFRRFMH